MTRTTFFKHFELLADQPDAVAKMRGLVLELAIRGQLVERNSKDEPAAKLLEKIKTDKREFLRVNKLKDSEVPPQISADEVPFKCPSAWEWVRLGSISNRIHYGYTASADHSQRDVRLLRITDIQDNQVNWETVPGCHISAQEVAKYALHDNDILIARTGGTIGKTFLVASVAVKAVFASYLIRVIPSSQVSARYLKLFLESPCYWRQLLAKSAGTGQPNVNGEALSGLCISLPPLAEQRRIVAKVDELMALCGELEQRQQSRQHARSHLQQSALHHLLAAREPQTFAAAWQRVRDHFHLLHDTPDAIPQLRQAILQLAVQGRIAKGATDPEAGKQKLGDVIDLISGQHLVPSEYNKERKGIPYLTGPADFGPRYPTASRWTETPKVVAKKGDILLTVKGAGVGKTNVVQDQEVAISRQLMAVRSKSVDLGFIELSLKSAFDAFQAASNGIAIPGISRDDVLKYRIWIPPLAEQKRIVARVEELLRWCDTLEAQLHQTRTLGAHLLASTLHHLLAA